MINEIRGIQTLEAGLKWPKAVSATPGMVISRQKVGGVGEKKADAASMCMNWYSIY